jgi:hypothetical protein
MPFDVRANSWPEFQRCLHDLEVQARWACRGEAQCFPRCLPSIDRLTLTNWSNDPLGRLALENTLVAKFKQQSAVWLAEYEREIAAGDLSCLTLMQHFGGPTRLLDWSNSLWIAAYFACLESPADCGRLLCFDKRHLTINVVSAFPDQTARMIEGMSEGLFSPAMFTIYDRWLVGVDLFSVSFPRVIVQQGFFTVSTRPFEDHWQLVKDMIGLDPKMGMGFGTVTIEPRAKPEILWGLKHMGITAASLYPGLEELCRSLSSFALHAHLDVEIQDVVSNWVEAAARCGPRRKTARPAPPEKEQR